MGRQVNQLNVYLFVAALIFGGVTGYVLGLRPSQEMLTKMNQLKIVDMMYFVEEMTGFYV